MELLRLSRASRALYAFCHHTDFWKGMVMGEAPADQVLRFHGSWKDTYVRQCLTDHRGSAKVRCVLPVDP
jgi:hypothetical protein